VLVRTAAAEIAAVGGDVAVVAVAVAAEEDYLKKELNI